MISTLSSALSRLSISAHPPLQISKAFASGRWWPQPEMSSHSRNFSSAQEKKSESGSSKEDSPDSLKKPTDVAATSSPGTSMETSSKTSDIELLREKAAPVYAPPRYVGKKVYGTTQGEKGELLADYVLFEDSIQKAKVPWVKYNGLTSDERTIYMAHLKAVKQHKLTYKDPETGATVMTVSQLLLNGKCCGNGCRHCPYEHENMDPKERKKKKFNGSFYV